MPNKDTYHDSVIQASRADGWRVVREHALVSTDTRRLFIDILAERLNDQSHALFEVKDFDSPVEALATALGKYPLYQYALQFSGLDLPLFLAIPQLAYQDILSEPIGLYARQLGKFKWMIFDPSRMRINQYSFTWPKKRLNAALHACYTVRGLRTKFDKDRYNR